jgi:hypothetical protein
MRQAQNQQKIVSKQLRVLLAFCWYLNFLTLRPWRWRQFVHTKSRWTSPRLYRSHDNKIVLCIVTAVRTSWHRMLNNMSYWMALNHPKINKTKAQKGGNVSISVWGRTLRMMLVLFLRVLDAVLKDKKYVYQMLPYTSLFSISSWMSFRFIIYVLNYKYLAIEFSAHYQLSSRGSVVGWGTMLQAGRSRVRLPMK